MTVLLLLLNRPLTVSLVFLATTYLSLALLRCSPCIDLRFGKNDTLLCRLSRLLLKGAPPQCSISLNTS